MFDELLSLSAAALLFPLLIWVPGALLGYGINLLGYRERSLGVQLALPLLLSMGICPITVYLLARIGGFPVSWTFYGLVWIAAAVLAVTHRLSLLAKIRTLFSHHRGALVLVAVWFAVLAVSEIDVVLPNGVFRNLNTMDAVAHVAYTDALSRTGIPPVNPFVFPGHPTHLFYYYLWYLMCSLVDQLGGSVVTARAAVQAGAFYVGLSIAALITTYIQILGPRLFPAIRNVRTSVAIALLTITGLDLIPWIFCYVMKAKFNMGPGAGASLEWWNEQVTAWFGAVLMSPHHPVGMVLCFTGLLMLIGFVESHSLSQKLCLIAAASLAWASAAGISVYTVLAFSVGVALWIPIALRRRGYRYVLPICVAAILAGLLYLPFALELRASSRTHGVFPLALHIREFSITDYWLPSIVRSLKTKPTALYALRFIFLPLNYFLELGFFFVAAGLYWRWRRSLPQALTMEEQLLTCIALGSVLVCTFLRSTFGWNDLGWRGFLVAQFVLLLWAAPVAQYLIGGLDRMGFITRRWRFLTWACVIIGVAGTLTEVINLRVRSQGPTGPETVGIRDTYIWVDHHTPRDKALLFNPDITIEYFNSLYGFRQTVAAGRAYARPFFVPRDSEKESQDVLDEAVAFFSSDHPTRDILSVCHRYHLGAIIVTSDDPIWKDGSSWVWRIRPSFENHNARVFTFADLERQIPVA